MKIMDIMNIKGNRMISVRPDCSLFEAIKVMTSAHVGSALVVKTDGTLVGIVTERDILRHSADMSAPLEKVSVSSVMTTDLIVAVPEDDVDTMITTMVENHFRHLPVMDNGRLAGVVSMGDLVKSQLRVAKAENRHLKDYISGKYPA